MFETDVRGGINGLIRYRSTRRAVVSFVGASAGYSCCIAPIIGQPKNLQQEKLCRK